MFLINKINLFHLKVTKICKNKIVKIRVYMHLLYARKYCSFKYLPFLNNFVSILEGRGGRSEPSSYFSITIFYPQLQYVSFKIILIIICFLNVRNKKIYGLTLHNNF